MARRALLHARRVQAYPTRRLSAERPLTVVTWNLGKRARGPAVLHLLALRRVHHAHFVALQESHEGLALPDCVGGHFARGFRRSGVMTLSTCQPSVVRAVRAPTRELRVTTAKVALLASYPLDDGRQLAVVNVHALNFERKGLWFARQMHDLTERVLDHPGPVILCGDMNTWSPSRLDVLHAEAERLGLQEVMAQSGIGRTGGAGRLGNAFLGLDPTLALDRIFYRGLALEEHRWLPDLDASDHVPLLATFRVEA
jgi:endonuclease/exonuclease/phosphatase (EEP) superfamily protein YafD